MEYLTFENLLNAGLAIGVLLLAKSLLTPAPKPKPRVKREPLPLRNFTLSELSKFDGKTPQPDHDIECPVYLAVNFKVFDVSAGRGFYGPGGPYECFAGKDASRGLATMEMTGTDKWDDLEGLKLDQLTTMRDWEDKFTGKYTYRGKLIKEEDKDTAPPPQ